MEPTPKFAFNLLGGRVSRARGVLFVSSSLVRRFIVLVQPSESNESSPLRAIEIVSIGFHRDSGDQPSIFWYSGTVRQELNKNFPAYPRVHKSYLGNIAKS